MVIEKIAEPNDLRNLNYNELKLLCRELRSEIVSAVSRSGGHLGSNLGAVELTVALHRVYDSPRDAILWDTGHQAYTHKLLTGRREMFDRLRQEDGISGYPSRAESEHDWIENSHASTVLSYAHGLTKSFEAKQLDRKVVAVIGDGSLTGGMAYEALNNIGCSGTKCTIVLNDNGRSYAPTVSRLNSNVAKFRIHPTYLAAKAKIERGLREIPGVGEFAVAKAKSVKEAVRELVEPHMFFEPLGIRYLGPINGHDIASMEEAFETALELDSPALIHVLTQKGRGYKPAETDDDKCLHDTSAFNPEIGPDKWAPAGYTKVFSDTINELGYQDDRVYGISAAMSGPVGLQEFAKNFPDRFVDVGIAEQHAATLAAGLAMGGMRPYLAVYSTFFARCFDQALYDIALHNLPVTFVLDRAGVTGEDGASHNGVFDIALCNAIPGMTILAPSSEADLAEMLRFSLTLDGPVAIRYPKGASRITSLERTGSGLEAVNLKSASTTTTNSVSSTTTVCILALGKMVEAAELAAEMLTQRGIETSLWDARCARPLDRAMLDDAERHELIVTIEDGITNGGFGSLAQASMVDSRRVHVMGVPTEFIRQANPDVIRARLGLDASGIVSTVLQLSEELTSSIDR